jgi:hypothetical protein
MRDNKSRDGQGLGQGPQVGRQANDQGARLATLTEGARAAREDYAGSSIVVVADRQGRRAAESIRSGKPTGKGQGWRLPSEVSATSQDEARQSSALACVKELSRLYGRGWAVRAPWSPPIGPGTRKQVAFRRYLALTAWRGAYRELAMLPGGVTGRRDSGAYSLMVDNESDDAKEAQRLAVATFDPAHLDGPDLERSLGREVSKARDTIQAKRQVWRLFLAPYKGNYKLSANERRSKLGAIRRARIVCLLLEGQGVGLPSFKLSPILKALDVPISHGRRSLAADLARLSV